MNITNFDIFSTSFQFNLGKQRLRKRTLVGAFLSVSVILIALSYFLYLLYQYLNNLIDPKFRAQSFITESDIDMDFRNDLVGFNFWPKQYLSLDTVQAQQNKTYLVFQVYLQIINNTDYSVVKLDTYECPGQQLSGFNCIDFSKVQNYTLSFRAQSNYRCNLVILGYKCQDTDAWKTTVPDNCASPEEIESLVTYPQADFNLKLLSSQYNTSSNQIQVNYRNNYIRLSPTMFSLKTYKTQKQITTIKQGAVIQKESSFSSPISYTSDTQTQDLKTLQAQTGLGVFMQATIEVDEIVQHFTIEYPTIPEILALCNSTLAVLMCVGFIGRYFSEQLIREDFFIFYLQNMYQQTYQKILKLNKLFQCNKEAQKGEKIENVQLQLQQKPNDNKENIEEQIQNDQCQANFVPSIITKSSRKSVFSSDSQIFQLNVNCKYTDCDQKDQIIENTQQNIKEQKIQTNQNNILLQEQMIGSQKSEDLQKLERDQSQQIETKFLETVINSPKSLINNTQNSDIYPRQLNFDQRKMITQKKSFQFKEQNISPKEICELNAKKEKNVKNNYINLITQSIKAVHNYPISQKIRKIIFGIRIWKKNEYIQNSGLDPKARKIIIQQIEKGLDIFQLYSDILFLKKAVMILLSKDQYAAIKMIGFSDFFAQQEANSDITKHQSNQTSKKYSTSHFEKLFSISQSEELQIKYLHEFIDRYHQSSDLSQVDQRIFSSLKLAEIN
ncbi:AMP-binding enzyme family protein (macronuclear) [Tetrahymena thermophila SB210]|uniref:AMP-binding enzyme family protein n=1 Tax=Tetrahymena thermophila (strain SB210) TaxID=312017 RepID=I7M257_TETTS|nr:AMP-binding enzyme family protein [Tetrahymena thermophila SB210]EAR99364.1 AMP-binding enzyme family protein [Tetrahymena thermophila SB210]|eukprot:XP_001019609.1 AMP-binding enzyme family protein [Tetrahymena thermophila SB210]